MGLYAAAFAAYLMAWWSVVGAHAEQHGRTAAHPVWTFLEIVSRSLLLWVWPGSLGVHHDLTFTTHFDAVTAAWVVLGIGASLGMIVACWRRRPLVSWCLLWVFAGLAPLAPLPWMTVNGLMQENRMAFSAVALAWLTALAAREALAIWRVGVARCSRRIRRSLEWVAVGAGLIIVILAVITDRARSAVWSDDVTLWQEASTRSPDSRSVQINLGGAYMARNDYNRAEDAFRRAAAITPNEALPYYALGTLAYRRRQYDQAKSLFLKTASMAPDYAATYRMLGLIAIKQSQDGEAAVFLRRAVTLDPRDAAAQGYLGLVAQRAGDHAVAERLYRDTLAMDPAQSLARNNLGTLYLKQGRWADALEQFSELLDRDPNDYDAALNRAVALDALGRRKEAKAGLDTLVARLPPDPRFDAHRRSAALMLSRVAP
jgi:tetratricopeptide (TPR) repeat protein